MATGDGASGFSETRSAAFTSGDAVKIAGTIASSGATVYLASDYGMAQCDGIYLENRDSTNYITVILKDGSDNALSTLAIAPEGVFAVRCDDSQTAIAKVSLQANTAPCEFILCIAE